MSEVSIEWARDARGVWRWAGEFLGVQARDYRGIVCSHDHPLIPVAGESGKVAPHFRHEAAGTGCTAEETTEHYRGKERVAAWLSASPGRAVQLAVSCRVTECGQRTETTWEVPAWSHVAIEGRVGTRRPDIVLLDGVTPVAAIEIMHTHRVDARKRAELTIPWIEVSTLFLATWAGGAFSTEQRSDDVSAMCACCRKRDPMRASKQDYIAARQWSEARTLAHAQSDAGRAERAAQRAAIRAHWDRVWGETRSDD
jgi:hypothetical protein